MVAIERLTSVSIGLLFLAPMFAGCKRTTEVKGEAFTLKGKVIVQQAGIRIHVLSAEQNERFRELLRERQKNLDAIAAQNAQDHTNRMRAIGVKLRSATTQDRCEFLRSYRIASADRRSDAEILLEFGAKQPELLDDSLFRADFNAARAASDLYSSWKVEKSRDPSKRVRDDHLTYNLQAESLPQDLKVSPRVLQHYRALSGTQRGDASITLEITEKYPEYLDRFPDLQLVGERVRFLEETSSLGKAFDLEAPTIRNFLDGTQIVVGDSEGKFSTRLDSSSVYFVVARASVGLTADWHFKFSVDGQKLILSDSNKMGP